jgi:hypothetical protein
MNERQTKPIWKKNNMTASEFADFDVFRTPISSGAEPSLISSRPTVMLIDDDENICETLQFALKDSFDVITCTGGDGWL